jgi:hypothetical protein
MPGEPAVSPLFIIGSDVQEYAGVTRVAGPAARVPLLATEQCHDLGGTHAFDIAAGCRSAQAADKTLPSRLGALGAHDLQRAGDFHDLYLIALMQVVLGAKVRGDGDLPPVVEDHSVLFPAAGSLIVAGFGVVTT